MVAVNPAERNKFSIVAEGFVSFQDEQGCIFLKQLIHFTSDLVRQLQAGPKKQFIFSILPKDYLCFFILLNNASFSYKICNSHDVFSKGFNTPAAGPKLPYMFLIITKRLNIKNSISSPITVLDTRFAHLTN